MIWLFVLLLGLSGIYLIHVFSGVDRHAVLSGFFLVFLAVFMELINDLIGPFWIAQDSVYLLLAGLPVEKLLLYATGGTAACLTFKSYRDSRTRWAMILGIGLSLALLELILNQTMVFRWIRPWTVIGAFIYYCVGAWLLFRFYEAPARRKAATIGLLALGSLVLGGIHLSRTVLFPLVR